jgi:ABC-type Zn uptake system ZnuABC Zn-binding protein ZnuA
MLGLMVLDYAGAEAGLNVVATTEHYAAIARIVGGDRIIVAYLAPNIGLFAHRAGHAPRDAGRR